jgi:hypothetical protein
LTECGYGQVHLIGFFAEEEEAARAFDVYVLEARGLNTQINFHPADYGIEVNAPEPAAPASQRTDVPSDRGGRFHPEYFCDGLHVAHRVAPVPDVSSLSLCFHSMKDLFQACLYITVAEQSSLFAPRAWQSMVQICVPVWIWAAHDYFCSMHSCLSQPANGVVGGA